MKQNKVTVYFAGIVLTALAACSGGADDTAVNADSITVEAAAPAPVASNGLIDPDLATREQLLAVPGLDATSADALISGRPYANMLEVDAALTAVPEAQRKQAYVTLFKPIDLNTAAPEEMMLIPGMTDHLTHEFEEYRPYTEIQRFRTEIGKYVDATVVARLERYVAIRLGAGQEGKVG